jgi:hypothetical protein
MGIVRPPETGSRRVKRLTPALPDEGKTKNDRTNPSFFTIALTPPLRVQEGRGSRGGVPEEGKVLIREDERMI